MVTIVATKEITFTVHNHGLYESPNRPKTLRACKDVLHLKGLTHESQYSPVLTQASLKIVKL